MTLPMTKAAGEAGGAPGVPGETRAERSAARTAKKARLRRQFRAVRLAALADSQALILAAARRELPALLPAGLRLGIYWPLSGEVDLRPLAALDLPLALPAVWAEPPPGPCGAARSAGASASLQDTAGPSPEPGPTRSGATWSGVADLGSVLRGPTPSGRDGSAATNPGMTPAPQLLYRPWHPGDALAPDHCGIPAPLASGRSGAPQPTSGSRPAATLTQALPPADKPPSTDLPGSDRQATGLSPTALGLLLVPALAIDRQGIRLGYGGGWYDRLRADPAWRAVPALAVLPAACVVETLPRDGWDVPFAGWLDESGLHWINGGNIASL